VRLSVVVRGRVKRSVSGITRAAAIVALLGLASFAISVLYPAPLVVIFSMSAGHAIGVVAVLLYLLAIVLDTVQAGQVDRARAVSRDSVSRDSVSRDSVPGAGSADDDKD